MPLFRFKPPGTTKAPQSDDVQQNQAVHPVPTPVTGTQTSAQPLQLPAIAYVLRDGKAVDVLVQIGAVMRSFDARHRHSHNQALVTIYAVAERLRENEDDRMDFCGAHAWEAVRRNRPRPDRPDLMLRHALRAANGLADKAASKRASKQFRALGPLFDQRVPYTQIDQKLKEQGGIDGLAKAHAKPRTPRSSTKMGARLILNPGPQTAYLNEQQPGHEVLVHMRVTAVKDGVVHADVVRTGKPQNKNNT